MFKNYFAYGQIPNGLARPTSGAPVVYPPRNADEVRMASILEEILRKLNAIEKKLDERQP